ncbi:MAG TPA: GWxTD domain-containing protein, partial [Patescibacteria group bacterium]|nr:GWxTD domain-containing protein [Patescibacteria group bacterium]
APPGSRKDGFDDDARFDRLDQDERSYILGLQYLMNCFQWKQYLTFPTRREREEWIERFWLYLDPTPTTPENERRIEHEMRVATARQHFAMGRDPGWDRRGEIFIRFGDPDSRTILDPDVSERGAAPPREQWYYGTFDMLISFADITHNGEYFYDEEIPYSIHSILRAMTDPFAAYNFSIYPYEMIPMIMPDLKTPKEEIAEIIEYCHEADIRKERLPAFVDVTTFRGGPGMLKTEISFEIPGEELELEYGNGEEQSEIEIRVLVRNARMDSVEFASDCITAFTPELRQRPYSDLIPAQICVTLRPGYYRFGMEVIDRSTGRSSSYRKSIQLSALDQYPAVSDIQFAGRIRETEENNRFVKGRLEVVPHPTHVYRKPRPVIFYFEVYGLDTDQDGLAFYSVEYTVTPLDKRRWGPVLLDVDTEISSSFETSGFGSMQPLRLTIDTGELRESAYELLVSVRDRRTLALARQRSTFYVLE